MKNQNQHSPKENDKPVSRKTNEEIDEDDEGNLLVGGKIAENNLSQPSDGPLGDDLTKGENTLNENETHLED